MNRVEINGKTFEVSVPEADIRRRVKELAQRLSQDLEGQNPLFVAILNGSFIFAADLMREMTIPCEISFVKLASYQGTASTGTVQEVIGLNEDLTGRTVVIVEDIVESGLTIQKMKAQAAALHAGTVKVCTLFFKPALLREGTAPDYVAFEIPNAFIVGYGLDYDRKGRQLREVYSLIDN